MSVRRQQQNPAARHTLRQVLQAGVSTGVERGSNKQALVPWHDLLEGKDFRELVLEGLLREQDPAALCVVIQRWCLTNALLCDDDAYKQACSVLGVSKDDLRETLTDVLVYIDDHLQYANYLVISDKLFTEALTALLPPKVEGTWRAFFLFLCKLSNTVGPRLSSAWITAAKISTGVSTSNKWIFLYLDTMLAKGFNPLYAAADDVQIWLSFWCLSTICKEVVGPKFEDEFETLQLGTNQLARLVFQNARPLPRPPNEWLTLTNSLNQLLDALGATASDFIYVAHANEDAEELGDAETVPPRQAVIRASQYRRLDHYILTTCSSPLVDNVYEIHPLCSWLLENPSYDTRSLDHRTQMPALFSVAHNLAPKNTRPLLEKMIENPLAAWNYVNENAANEPTGCVLHALITTEIPAGDLEEGCKKWLEVLKCVELFTESEEMEQFLLQQVDANNDTAYFVFIETFSTWRDNTLQSLDDEPSAGVLKDLSDIYKGTMQVLGALM